MNKNFDEYDDNPLNEKTFAELGATRMQDIDMSELLLYVRDSLQRAGEDLCGDGEPLIENNNVVTQRLASTISDGVACKNAAMYVNLAINSVLAAMTFKKAG